MWKAWRRWPIRKAYNAGDWSGAASLARRELTTGNRAFAQDIVLRSLYNQQAWQEVLAFISEHPEADDGTYERRARLKLAQVEQAEQGEPTPDEDRPWNGDDLLSNWLQEGQRVWMRHPWGWTHWDMPEGYSLAKTHPSLLHLAMQMLIGQWVPTAKQWSVDAREPGERLALAYSGGVDSTAALLLLPDDTILAYHQRNFDSMLSHTLPLATFGAIKQRTGREVLCIPSNHERIRTHHGKVNGFSDAHAAGVHLVLLADHLNLAGIAFGTPIDNTWLKRGSVFRDFATDPYWTTSRAMFAKAGLAYVLPINHLSEAGALEVCRQSELADVVNSCLRGVGERWCGRCWKCFHKNGPLGREFDPNAPEITTFLNTKPLRTAQHALWALQVQRLEHLAPHLSPHLKTDLSWWTAIYPPGLELIDEPWRATVEQGSDAVLSRMTEPYPLESVHIDTSSLTLNLNGGRSHTGKHEEVRPQGQSMDDEVQHDGAVSVHGQRGSSNERLKARIARNEREIRRLRNSVSFQLGLHLTNAVRQPWRLPFLPLTFPLHAFRLGLQRLGKRPVALTDGIESTGDVERNHCIVLFPTNGVGFGHFTRMYAVARALRKADPSLEIVFFTPMPTLHVLYSDQFPTYHLAGRYKHANMSATQWNGLVEDMLHLVFDQHRPRWFMFDGAFPYRGMLNAIASQKGMEKWWMRRGSMKANTSVPVDSFDFFDGFIVPGEATGDETEREHVVPPIRVMDPDEVWDRSYARSRLAVPEDAKVVYVQLGAGRINDIEGVLNRVLDALFAHEHVHVVLGESMLGERLDVHHERLRVIRDYPNSLYIKGFDAAVQAGGYNSYQEMRTFGVPTLFIPNTDTGMDDQVKRCKQAEEEGWGLVAYPDETSFESAIGTLLRLQNSPRSEDNGAASVPNLLGIHGP